MFPSKPRAKISPRSARRVWPPARRDSRQRAYSAVRGETDAVLIVAEALHDAAAADIARLVTVLPSFLMNAALRYITAQANAAIGAVSPIATILLAVFFLGEALTAVSALGGLLVIFGVAWFMLAEPSKPRC